MYTYVCMQSNHLQQRVDGIVDTAPSTEAVAEAVGAAETKSTTWTIKTIFIPLICVWAYSLGC